MRVGEMTGTSLEFDMVCVAKGVVPSTCGGVLGGENQRHTDGEQTTQKWEADEHARGR